MNIRFQWLVLLGWLAMAPWAGAADYSGLSLREALGAAAYGDHRAAENIARNRYRHPVETLEFFGLRRDMTVIEIAPGGLWYTEILAPVLKGGGKLVAAGYDADLPGQPEYRYKQQEAMQQRFSAEPGLFGEVALAKFSPPESVQLGEAGSADMVLTFRNTHGWLRDGIADKVFRAFFEVLKPGGVLGLVQHRTPDPAPVSADNFTGYVSEQQVIALATAAGFVLEAKSEINANPADTHDHPKGVWTLPPSLRLGEQDKDKYLAIGESDRMTLRFRKPQ